MHGNGTEKTIQRKRPPLAEGFSAGAEASSCSRVGDGDALAAVPAQT